MQLLRTSHRFQIPLIKLSANVSSLAILHLPISIWAVYNSLVDDEHKFRLILCVAKTHFHLVQSIDGMLKMSLLTRILFDAVVGFVLDREMRARLPMRHWWVCCCGEVEKEPTMSISRSSKVTDISRTSKITDISRMSRIAPISKGESLEMRESVRRKLSD